MSRQRCLTNTSTWRAFNAHNTTTEQRPYKQFHNRGSIQCVYNTHTWRASSHGTLLLATMCILCHRQYVLQDLLSFTISPAFISSFRSTIRRTMCLKFCILNLKDNACFLELTVCRQSLTAAAFLTSCDNLHRDLQEQFDERHGR